ncbi:hypothetical protein P43SY_011030 [Pythium insidiosum]|uniref:Uncharacterized protein n=1 Tax=Pythium insidiosum TaxID=114742 RepID=A0AAD5Q174_PYTIN|nr:hypothetical protein P43SY_011030 [Pythium insidiosum]
MAAARGVLDQRLLYLFNATAASAAHSPAAAPRGDDDWTVPAAGVLSAVLGDDGETLFSGEPQPAPPAADVLAEVAEAARLAAALRSRYGAHRLFERISSTALACSWLTHVVQSLFELVRLQDLERFADQESPPLAALEAYSRAQIAASQRRSAQRDDALRESLARCRSLEHQLAAARAGEVEITRQHEMLADLFDRRGASLDAARQRLVEADRQRDRLEARVSELEGQLADLRRLFDESTPGLSSRQARHVFSFLWQHGYGQGNASLWGELVRACAHADPSLAPVDISLIVVPAGRSAPSSHAAPDPNLFDDSGLDSSPTGVAPAPASASSPARSASAPRAPTLGSTHGAFARRHLDFQSRFSAEHRAQDEEGDYEMGDDGDFEDDDLGDDDLCVAISATQASASLPPAAPPRPAPLVIDVDADDAADAPPAHADCADHADAADSEVHSARGVKRRAASLVAEDAMSAQRLARQLRTEGLGTPASAKRNRSSPGSGPSPTIASITTGSQATSPAGSTPSAGASPSRRELVAAAALARSQGDNVGGGDAGGAAPSAPGGAPLTFTGSDAASHVASYTAVPAAPPGVALAPPVFPRVPLPFALGNVRGRSSVLQYNSLDETQRPWDAMWRGRVRHVFLFNPNQLSAPQVDWINQVLRFMYRYRRQYWQRQHWFPLSRQFGAPPSITAAYATREASDRELVVAFRALTDSAPPGTSTALFWSEPAFWWVSARQCAWPLLDAATVPFEDQLRRIDVEEPVRVGWASAPGRFVEGLIREQLSILDANAGECWELPPPWDDPNYQPDV